MRCCIKDLQFLFGIYCHSTCYLSIRIFTIRMHVTHLKLFKNVRFCKINISYWSLDLFKDNNKT